MDVKTTIPMPRPRNPSVDQMTFEALVKRVEALEKIIGEQGKRGRKPKDAEEE